MKTDFGKKQIRNKKKVSGLNGDFFFAAMGIDVKISKKRQKILQNWRTCGLTSRKAYTIISVIPIKVIGIIIYG